MADPPRMYIIHLKSGDTVSAQFNPTELNEKIAVVWRDAEAQGGSGQESHYAFTRNLRISFELAFDARSAASIELGGTLVGGASRTPGIELARRFILACCFAPKGGQDVRGGSPSRLLFVWPRLYSLVVKLHDVEITHAQVDSEMRPEVYVAKLDVAAVHVRRLTYEDVLQHGTMLHDASAEG